MVCGRLESDYATHEGKFGSIFQASKGDSGGSERTIRCAQSQCPDNFSVSVGVGSCYVFLFWGFSQPNAWNGKTRGFCGAGNLRQSRIPLRQKSEGQSIPEE